MDCDLLAKQLAAIVGAEHVFAGEQCARYAVDGKAPRVAAFPATVEELSGLMKLASRERMTVVPWGSGTQIGLGGIPSRVDFVVGLGRFNRVIDHEPADLTATFEAGALLREVRAYLSQSGQFLPLDPPFGERATIGGILATNASGPRRLRYGAARDLVIGIRVVHADGTITRGGAKVVKNVSGYDMPKLYIGSLGTLGIIVEATFRIYPLPTVERTWVASFQRGEAAACAVAQILASTVVPSGVELLSASAAQSVARQAGLAIPQGSIALACSVGSVADAVGAQIAQIKKICDQNGAGIGVPLEGDVQATFWATINEFVLGESPGGIGAVLKTSVLLTKVLETIHRGEELARSIGLESAAISEAGNGIVRHYWTGQASSRDTAPDVMAKAIDTFRESILRDGGSLMVLSAPPAVKAIIDVWGPVGRALPLMQELKRQFDPQMLLNPGRFVGGI